MVQPTAVIGKGINVQGTISGEGDLLIEGRLQGQIQLQNQVLIANSASVAAEIDAQKITVLGQAEGSWSAAQVELKSSAQVNADVRTPSIVMEEGASFQGKLTMDLELPEGWL